jgi:peptide/nickel transport system permease protein
MSQVTGLPPPPSAEVGSDGAIIGSAPELKRASAWVHLKHLLRTSWLFRVGLALVVVACVLAVIGPWIAPYPVETATADTNLPPSREYWFGTDPSGFDVFSRVIAAPRVDVAIALAATAFSLIIGAAVGLAVSFFRGWFGEVTMRIVDMIQSFPLFVLAIIIVVMAGRSVWNVIIVVALLNIPIYIRLVRAEVLAIRERTFVEAARAGGSSELSIACRDVLPNAMSPALAQAPITVGFAILTTAGLSFIGAGVRPPTPEWGAMIAAGTGQIIVGQWWTSFFPGVAISLTVFGFAVVGEALRAILLRHR